MVVAAVAVDLGEDRIGGGAPDVDGVVLAAEADVDRLHGSVADARRVEAGLGDLTGVHVEPGGPVCGVVEVEGVGALAADHAEVGVDGIERVAVIGGAHGRRVVACAEVELGLAHDREDVDGVVAATRAEGERAPVGGALVDAHVRVGHGDVVVTGTECHLDELELAVGEDLVDRHEVVAGSDLERAARHAEVTARSRW